MSGITVVTPIAQLNKSKQREPGQIHFASLNRISITQLLNLIREVDVSIENAFRRAGAACRENDGCRIIRIRGLHSKCRVRLTSQIFDRPSAPKPSAPYRDIQLRLWKSAAVNDAGHMGLRNRNETLRTHRLEGNRANADVPFLDQLTRRRRRP